MAYLRRGTFFVGLRGIFRSPRPGGKKTLGLGILAIFRPSLCAGRHERASGDARVPSRIALKGFYASD